MAITRCLLCFFLRLSSFQGTNYLERIVSNHHLSVMILTEKIALSKLNKQKAVNFLSVHKDCIILRKEVIQPHLPIRLPCYDFTPIICPTLGGWLLTVTPPTSGVTNSRGVTGGVYKARERIHRGMLIRDY
jgi:hypothetical protein